MTEKLYDKDAYLSEFAATVVDCIPVGDGFDVVLDATAFFPEGGGQYGDTGSIRNAAVSDTQIRDGTVFHRTDRPLTVGETVSCRIDWDERFRRMQNHSGEHIVSGIVHSLLGYENVGFHLSASEMTMDYDGELTADDLLRVEMQANAAVFENRRIFCEYPSEEGLKELAYRSKKELTEAVRIVTVDGIDTCACCAPHVRRTGEIGGIFIVDSIRWKGGTRITIRCGSDAYAEYRSLREDERSLSSLFSSPRGQIAPLARHMQQEFSDLRRRFGQLQRENALLQLERIPDREGNLCFLLSDADADILRCAANEGSKKCTGVFVALSGTDEEGYRYVITARTGGLRSVSSSLNLALHGKGGGSDAMLCGTFSATQREIYDYFKEFQI